MLGLLIIVTLFSLAVFGLPSWIKIELNRNKKLAEEELTKQLQEPRYCIRFMVSSSNTAKYTDKFEPRLYATSKECAERSLGNAFGFGRLIDNKGISYPMCNVTEAQVVKVEE